MVQMVLKNPIKEHMREARHVGSRSTPDNLLGNKEIYDAKEKKGPGDDFIPEL